MKEHKSKTFSISKSMVETPKNTGIRSCGVASFRAKFTAG
jgi:hypothetical protein